MTLEPTTPLDYAARADRPAVGPLARAVLAVGYVGLVLLPCALIVLVGLLPPWAIIATFLAYAFALLPTYHLDHWLLGGVGFHSPVTFAVLAVVVAVLLWPMPLLSAAPTVWRSPRWRRAVLAYTAAFTVFALLAGWQMTRSWGAFFG